MAGCVYISFALKRVPFLSYWCGGTPRAWSDRFLNAASVKDVRHLVMEREMEILSNAGCSLFKSVELCY